MDYPKTLNGYPVRYYTPRNGSQEGALRVIVERTDTKHQRWVLASWHPIMGEREWCWGAYHDTLHDARLDAQVNYGLTAANWSKVI